MNSSLLMRTGLGLILVSVFMGCAGKPNIVLEAKQHGENIDFDIRTKGINGLLDLQIWQTDTKEVIWQLNLNSFNGTTIEYGKVPVGFKSFNGGTYDAEQMVPLTGKRPGPLPAGKSFIIALGAQYDTLTSAAMRPFYFLFSTDANGKISRVLPTGAPKPGDLPK